MPETCKSHEWLKQKSNMRRKRSSLSFHSPSSLSGALTRLLGAGESHSKFLVRYETPALPPTPIFFCTPFVLALFMGQAE